MDPIDLMTRKPPVASLSRRVNTRARDALDAADRHDFHAALDAIEAAIRGTRFISDQRLRDLLTALSLEVTEARYVATHPGDAFDLIAFQRELGATAEDIAEQIALEEWEHP